jgi:hypothetical protein
MNNKVKNNTEEPKAAPIYQNQVRLVGFLGKDPEQYENRTVLSLATETVLESAGFGRVAASHRMASRRRLGQAGRRRSLSRQGRLLADRRRTAEQFLPEAREYRCRYRHRSHDFVGNPRPRRP